MFSFPFFDFFINKTKNTITNINDNPLTSIYNLSFNFKTTSSYEINEMINCSLDNIQIPVVLNEDFPVEGLFAGNCTDAGGLFGKGRVRIGRGHTAKHFGVEEVGLWLLVDLIGLASFSKVIFGFDISGELIAKVILAIVVVILNYVFSKLLIFRKKSFDIRVNKWMLYINRCCCVH